MKMKLEAVPLTSVQSFSPELSASAARARLKLLRGSILFFLSLQDLTLSHYSSEV